MRKVRLGEVLNEDGEGGGEGGGTPAANSATGPGIVYPERRLGAPAAKKKRKPDTKATALLRQVRLAEHELKIFFEGPRTSFAFQNARLLARQTGKSRYVFYKENLPDKVIFGKNLQEVRENCKAYLEVEWSGNVTQWVAQSGGWVKIDSE